MRVVDLRWRTDFLVGYAKTACNKKDIPVQQEARPDNITAPRQFSSKQAPHWQRSGAPAMKQAPQPVSNQLSYLPAVLDLCNIYPRIHNNTVNALGVLQVYTATCGSSQDYLPGFSRKRPRTT